MNKNEWSMYQLLMRWAREDLAKAERSLADLTVLMNRFKPEELQDGNTEQPKGD
jgi:hypothetical protein